jgi:Kef-type K+ transport system membrane component KefB
MSLSGILAVDAAILVGLPYLAWRYLGLRHIAPLAVVQIVCGLSLGPSILGRVSPDFQLALFGMETLPSLSGVATVSVVLFSFLSGMHLDAKVFRAASRVDLGLSLSSFLVPLLLGTGLGYWFATADPGLIGPKATVWVFAVAIGICIAVTALPVLAALLKEMKIVDSALGQQALGFAAMTDGVLWISISALLIVSAGEREEGLWHLSLVPIYLIATLIILPRAMRRVAQIREGKGEASDTVLIVACTLAFTSAFVSEFTGLGYVIGAFLAGAAMPSDIRAVLIQRLDWPVTLLLMPFFFMVTGLRTEADLLSGPVLGMAAAATVFAIAGKILGVTVPAILLGLNRRRSLALGVLLQSKGLMEVLVVTVLIDAGIVTVSIFSALILVAVFCTILAMPLARLIIGTDGTRDETLGFNALGLQSGPARQ